MVKTKVLSSLALCRQTLLLFTFLIDILKKKSLFDISLGKLELSLYIILSLSALFSY